MWCIVLIICFGLHFFPVVFFSSCRTFFPQSVSFCRSTSLLYSLAYMYCVVSRCCCCFIISEFSALLYLFRDLVLVVVLGCRHSFLPIFFVVLPLPMFLLPSPRPRRILPFHYEPNAQHLFCSIFAVYYCDDCCWYCQECFAGKWGGSFFNGALQSVWV